MAPDSNGCSHYRRRCQVQAPCCKEFFSCHSCHDEEFSRSAQPSCPVEMKGTSGGGTAGRYLVERVRCNACLCEQAVGPSCLECGIDFAKHFCAPCKLYADPGAKGIFHCDECGICRVGKREDWFHCLKCEACYSVSTRDTHICVERALKSDCPICMEYLFTSSQQLHVGAHCGHAMHPEWCASCGVPDSCSLCSLCLACAAVVSPASECAAVCCCVTAQLQAVPRQWDVSVPSLPEATGRYQGRRLRPRRRRGCPRPGCEAVGLGTHATGGVRGLTLPLIPVPRVDGDDGDERATAGIVGGGDTAAHRVARQCCGLLPRWGLQSGGAGRRGAGLVLAAAQMTSRNLNRGHGPPCSQCASRRYRLPGASHYVMQSKVSQVV